MKKNLLLTFSLLLLSGFTTFGQSWVTTPGSSLPNDTVASTYYPYHATKTSSIKYGSSSTEVGDIYVPDYTGFTPPANSTSRPAIVVVHGGGGTSGTRTETRSVQTSQLFAAHGYVAFNIDYAIGSVYPQNIYDWRLAVRYLRAHAATYGIDPNHIGITGGSFGGYCAALMSGIKNGQRTGTDSATRYSNISLDTDGQGQPTIYSGDVQAAMDFYGPTTLSTANGNALGQFSGASSTTYHYASPTTYVSGTSVPTMISYGTSDGTVDPSNDTNFYNLLHTSFSAVGRTFSSGSTPALLANPGADLVTTTIPGGQHTFCIWDSTKGGTWGNTSGTIDLRKNVAQFFDAHLLATSSSPVAVNDTATANTGLPVIINVLANDSDPNNNTLTIQSVTQGAHGTSTITNSSTRVTYTPSNALFTGTDSFNYTITNGTSTATAQVNVTLTATNIPPVANDDTASTGPHTAVTIHVLANDTDANSDTLAIVGVTTPTSGSATAVQSGTNVVYTPNTGYSGTDTFMYTISDGHGGNATGNVTVTVSAAANQPPVAVNDTAVTAVNTPVTIHVLANDSDPNGDAISISSVGAAVSGTAVQSGTDVIYTPNSNFSGTDMFTYTITDGSLFATGTDTVTVSSGTGTSMQTVTVTTTATVESGSNAAVDINEATAGYLMVKYSSDLSAERKSYFQFNVSTLNVTNGTATFTVVPTNTYQQDVQLWALNQSYPTFSNVLDWNHAQANETGTSSPLGGHGMLTSGSYTATAIGSGVVIPTSGTSAYSFSVPNISLYEQGGKVTLVLTGVSTTGSSSSSGLRVGISNATLAVPVLNINHPPNAVDDTATTPVNTPVTIHVLANDSDPDNDPLTIQSVTAPANGTATISGTNIIYTPSATFSGGADSFTYTISDGNGGTDTATVNVSVTATQLVTVSTTATVESGANAAVDINEATAGYLMVKYSSDLTAARKAYFQFNVSSLNLVSSGSATFTVVPTKAYQQEVQLWALNQSYPTFSSVLDWNHAQANDTASNNMLTSGSYTATAIGSPVLVPTTSTNAFSFTIPNIGNYVQGGNVTLVLSSVDNASNNSSGLRVGISNETLNVPLNLNAPTIDQIFDQSTNANTPITISFNVNDAETPAASLVVTATTDNPALVTAAMGGSGSSRSLTLSPAANQAGGSTITLNVSDGSLTTTETFFLTVGTGLQNWWYQNFGTTDYSASSPAPYNGDADRDGLPNILEFALGANPNASDASTPFETLTAGTTIGLDPNNNPLTLSVNLPVTYTPVSYYDGTYVYLIYYKAASGDMNYVVQASYDLMTDPTGTDPYAWTTIGGSISGVPIDNNEYNINDVTYAVKYPWNSLTDPHVFLRLQVTPQY